MLSDKTPSISTVTLHTPSLGSITGLCYDDETCQYLGIPYATIPGRFRRSRPVTSWENGCWDGTKLGPYCPQPPRDFYPIPAAERPWLEMPATDEYNCLNLNISVPRCPSSASRPLPVMVFLHGGAFAYATGSAPIYDGRILSTISNPDFKQPTIIVSINYRLGVYGFLAGRDLELYNQQHGESGVGNYGIWDQILALRWVQKYIADFGGDPNRVTLFGQSAGGVSVNCHLLRGEKLFSSAILQSGLLRLCGVMTPDEYQILFEKMLIELGISLDLPASERIEAFLKVDTAKVTAAMVPVFVTPVITMALCDDGVLLNREMPGFSDYEQFQTPEWCPRIMIGDCINECIIWNKSWDNLSETRMKPGDDLAIPTASKLLAKMESYIGRDKSAALANIYGIKSNLSNKETFDIIERMTSHGMYSVPNYFAELAASSSTLYAYHFDVPSPYANAWTGMAHHSFDNVMIWGVLKHTLPKEHQQISEIMAEAWIKFANGEDPWQPFGESHRWMVFKTTGPELLTREQDIGRGYDDWETLHKNGLIADLSDLSTELCLRTSDLLVGAEKYRSSRSCKATPSAHFKHTNGQFDISL